MLVNAYADRLSSSPWLFSDLRRHFAEADCLSTLKPLNDADRWICIRAWESHRSPCIERTVVQLHCNEARLWGSVDDLRECGAIVYTHPSQIDTMRRIGMPLDKPSIMRPIGALELFQLRTDPPRRPSFGWFGRDTGLNKRTNLFVEACIGQGVHYDLDAVLVGSGLTAAYDSLRGRDGVTPELYDRDLSGFGIDDYSDIYESLDAVIITSDNESGPMCLFEALACGVPVITTRCGWAERLIIEGVNGFIVEPDPQAIGNAMLDIASLRDDWFARRFAIRASLMGHTLEGWVRECIELAEGIK